jgi:hypothetical protein
VLESVFGRSGGPMLYYGLYDAHDVALVTLNKLKTRRPYHLCRIFSPYAVQPKTSNNNSIHDMA